MPVQIILTDIEGTTSSVRFVYETLFPYARERMMAYVSEHEAELADVLEQVRSESGEAEADATRCSEILLQWMDEDRKATPLKEVQGRIWAQGYTDGTIKGHVYPDAVAALKHWHGQGLRLYVYSSGSVAAQKLIFGCSEAGDLTPLFSGYFDTAVGHKREEQSYRTITAAIGVPADSILFLSDVVQELDAAQAAGMQTCGLAREGGELAGHRTLDNFADILPAV